jgi:hypothetical protein
MKNSCEGRNDLSERLSALKAGLLLAKYALLGGLWNHLPGPGRIIGRITSSFSSYLLFFFFGRFPVRLCLCYFFLWRERLGQTMRRG